MKQTFPSILIFNKELLFSNSSSRKVCFFGNKKQTISITKNLSMMNRKFLNAVLCGALMLYMGTFSSCKDYDDDIDGLDNRLTVVEEATKKLQQQVEDAINNGKWIDYVEEQASEFILHLTNKNGAVETISIPKQGADVMYYFKVAADSEGEGEGAGSQNVWWYSNDGSNWQYVLDEATHSKMVFNSSSAIKESVTITSNENVSYVAIGGEQTTIKVDNTTKLLAEDKENGILVVKLGELNYTILLEESLFRGLNSVQYRPMQVSSEETLVAVTLKMKSDDTYTYEQPAWGYFRCLPATHFDPTADNVAYACQDLHIVTRATGSLMLTPVKEGATVDENGILKLGFQPQTGFEDDTYYKTLLDITMNGYTVSSDYFNVRKETHYIEEAVCYELGKGEVDVNEPLLFDINSGYPLDDKIMIGFKTGDNMDQLKSLKELGFPITVDYTIEGDNAAFSIGTDVNTGKKMLVKNNAEVGSEVVVYVKWTVNGETKPNCSFPVKFKVESLEQALGARDQTIQMSALESNYKTPIEIELETSGIAPEDWVLFKNRLNEQQAITLKYRYMENGAEKFASPVAPIDGTDPLNVKLDGDKLILTIGHHASFKEDISRNLFVMGVNNNVESVVQIEGGKTLYVQNVKVKYAPSVAPKASHKVILGDGNVIKGDMNTGDITELVQIYSKKQFVLQNTNLQFGSNAYVMPNQSVNQGCLLNYNLSALYDIKPTDLEVEFDIDRTNELITANADWGNDQDSGNTPGRFFHKNHVVNGVVTNTSRYDGAVKVNGVKQESNYNVYGGVPVRWTINDDKLPEGVKSEGCERWLMYEPFVFFGQGGGWEANLGDYAKLKNNKQNKVVAGTVTLQQLRDGVVLQELPINESDLVLVNALPYGAKEFKPWVWSDENGKVHFASKDDSQYGGNDPYSTNGQGVYYVWDGDPGVFEGLVSPNGKSATTLKLKSERTVEIGTELNFKAQYRYDAGSSEQGSLRLKLIVVD